MRLRSTILAVSKWLIRIWFFSIVVTVMVATGFLMAPQATTPNAAPRPDPGLDCLSCHTKKLELHSKLGSGNETCWACHDRTDMGMLNLADQTQIALSDSPRLCAQCHQKQYAAWNEGSHGGSSPGEAKCAGCHNPHQPQIVSSDAVKAQTRTVDAAPESNSPLDCMSCHTKVLKGHDKLGSGSEACWACHYKAEMAILHLAGGETQFPLSDFPRLCAQCHHERYEAWEEGTHGVAAWEDGGSTDGGDRTRCASCHDPHRPQVALLDITRPHPEPVPSPPPAPTQPLIMLGISLLLIIAAGVALAREVEWR